MKKSIGYILLSLIMVSCSSDGGTFRLEGRLRHLNQGEFYIYSTGNDNQGIDTIAVKDGQFAFSKNISHPITMTLVFPNFSEQPVFAEPGAKVKIKGSASQLKEMEITGTDDNELMTAFRMKANELTPPEIPQAIESLVTDHPASPVALYLIRKHLIQSPQPDYATACRLTGIILKNDKDNKEVRQLNQQLKSLRNSMVNSRLLAFKSKDIYGKNIDRKTLNGKVNVVCVWATWNYESQQIQRKLRTLKRTYKDDLAIVSINLDARQYDCKRFVEGDSVRWPNVCDGRIWESPLLYTFGLQTVKGNLIADKNGKILARNLNQKELEDKIKSLLKK